MSNVLIKRAETVLIHHPRPNHLSYGTSRMADLLLPEIRSDEKRVKPRTCRVCGAGAEVRWYGSIDTHCAECWKARVRRYYRDTKPERQEYERSRAMLPHRVAMREAYQQTDAGKAAVARAHKASQVRYPEKRRAHVTVGNAVRDGKLIKPTACERCHVDSSAKRALHAHHHDYNKPLDVEWLCGTCHRLEHRK